MAAQVVVLAALVFCCCVSVTLASLCDVCDCSKDDQMDSVSCHCQGNFQKMDLTQHLVDQRDRNVISLTVSDCRQVLVGRYSVSELPKLRTFKVMRASSVKMEAGSVDHVESLVLEDVASLELETKALLGATVKMLHLDRVTLKTLPKMALVDIKGLQSLMLMAVNVSHVEASAVRLAMGEKSEIIVENSHLGTVESKGVLVTSVGSFSLSRSSLDVIHEYGINVTAREWVRVDHSSFGADLSSKGLCTMAAEVNITGNSFSALPDGLLAKNSRHLNQGQRLLVADNQVVGQGLLDVPDIALMKQDDAVTYVGNSFECKCGNNLAEHLQKLQDGGFSGILENNFCTNKQCPKQVSHAMLLRHLQSGEGATCAPEELCKLKPGQTSTRTTTTTTTTTVKTPHQDSGCGHRAAKAALPLLMLAFLAVTKYLPITM